LVVSIASMLVQHRRDSKFSYAVQKCRLSKLRQAW
jgi:hypothetical protein